MSSKNDGRRADPSLTVGQKLQVVEARTDAAHRLIPREGQPGVIERARGAMLGLAVGDALGATLEFGARVASVKNYHREMTGGGPFGLEPGQWTDDTAMSFALAKSLTLRNGFDPHDVMARFVAWYRKGRVFVHGFVLRHRGDDAPGPGAFRADRRSLRGLDGREHGRERFVDAPRTCRSVRVGQRGRGDPHRSGAEPPHPRRRAMR